jgi:hypothetical protein
MVVRTWPTLIVAPIAALSSITFGYALVTPACERSQAWLPHVLILFCLLVSVSVTLMAWSALRAAAREFIPLIATWSGTFFSLVIAAQWAALLVLKPCMH